MAYYGNIQRRKRKFNPCSLGYFVRDGAYMQEVLGELTDLPVEAHGQPASAFSNDTMITWVQSNLGPARMAEIHNEVNAKLAANKARDPH